MSQSFAVRPSASLGMSAVVTVSHPVALSSLEWEGPAMGASGLSPTPLLPESEREGCLQSQASHLSVLRGCPAGHGMRGWQDRSQR